MRSAAICRGTARTDDTAENINNEITGRIDRIRVETTFKDSISSVFCRKMAPKMKAMNNELQ